MKLTLADVEAMGWAAALQKAHEALPHVTWHWAMATVRAHCRAQNHACCGCAAGLLAHAFGLTTWEGWGPEEAPLFVQLERVSQLTERARTWEEAIEALRCAEGEEAIEALRCAEGEEAIEALRCAEGT